MPLFGSAPATSSATQAATSPVTVTLSQAGITSDASNGLEYGAASPSGSTGQEVAIQSALNAAVATAAATGASGVKVVWDVAVALGGEIYLSSNMTVECPTYACGAIMRAISYAPIFRVQGMQANMGGGKTVAQGSTAAQALATQNTFRMVSTSPANASHPEYSRTFSASFVNVKNIEIRGGTWNANQPQQGTPPGVASSSYQP